MYEINYDLSLLIGQVLQSWQAMKEPGPKQVQFGGVAEQFSGASARERVLKKKHEAEQGLTVERPSSSGGSGYSDQRGGMDCAARARAVTTLF